MQFKDSHLSYCLNIHPGESFQEIFSAIKHYCPQVKAQVSPDQNFGLGLRLPAQAVFEMQDNEITELQNYLNENDFYAFTANVFPFGKFHGEAVKEEVYNPDWHQQERVDYTVRSAEILAELLPKNIQGSLSTVPITYGKESDYSAKENIILCLKALASIEEQTGKHIELALEPEPDCFLETSDECINYIQELRQIDAELVDKYLGVCLDTCHMALQFETPLESLNKFIEAGINISKIQVSSVLSFQNDSKNSDLLKKFDDGVYLHQTRIMNNGELSSYPDLPEAISDNQGGEWRIHCHVPLYFQSNDEGLSSTSNLLTKEFFEKAFTHCQNIEVETYTFSVLPDQSDSVEAAISKELLWLIDKA